MGCRDCEKPEPTEIGTANTTVNPHPITTDRITTSLTGANTAANHAPPTANANATATTDTFDRVAKVGRERGSESPIPVSPARAILGGRINASTMLRCAISVTATPTTAPRIPYWISREQVAPAIAPTMTDNTAAHTPKAHTAREVDLRVKI